MHTDEAALLAKLEVAWIDCIGSSVVICQLRNLGIIAGEGKAMVWKRTKYYRKIVEEFHNLVPKMVEADVVVTEEQSRRMDRSLKTCKNKIWYGVEVTRDLRTGHSSNYALGILVWQRKRIGRKGTC